MNLTVLNNTNELTMSSREIAELVGARPDSVKRTVERLAERGIFEFPPMVEIPTETKPAKVYLLDKRSSLIVVAQLCPEFTARVVDRWQELEEAAAKSKAPAVTLPDFTDPIAAARAWIAAMEQAKEVTEKLIEAQPKVEAFDHFMETEGHFGLRAAAKVLGISKPNKFTEWLRATGVLFKDGRGQNQPYASRSSGGG